MCAGGVWSRQAEGQVIKLMSMLFAVSVGSCHLQLICASELCNRIFISKTEILRKLI